jgi:protein required for attachment to host cells
MNSMDDMRKQIVRLTKQRDALVTHVVSVGEADARLIAAAPDLLAALRKTYRELLDVLKSINNYKVPYDGEDFHETLAAAQAAIVKATGVTP